MSLNYQQQIDTKDQFRRNFELAGLTYDEIASDLGTTPQIIENTLQLNTRYIEDPWILKEYLEDQIAKQGGQSIPFTALVGDYHNYWFLNSRRIEKRKIG